MRKEESPANWRLALTPCWRWPISRVAADVRRLTLKDRGPKTGSRIWSEPPYVGCYNHARRCNHGDALVSRFSNRSLARSKIKRDGLKAGSSAPDFRLPRLDGGELSLKELRCRRVLLVFSDPECGPCNTLVPKLEKFHREQAEISVVMISRGEPKENRAKVKEHRLTFPVVLQ